MAGWVGALAEGSEDNWTICKARRLWGTPSRSGSGVEVGDDLFIWEAGRGWLAHCRATSQARPPSGTNEVPWPEPERYRYVFDIELLTEVRSPVPMPAAELLASTGLPTVRLGQFPKLVDEGALRRLRAIFASGPVQELEVAGLDIPEGYDTRDVIARAIAVRRGQKVFRSELFDAYGGECAITGCAVPGVLEAAHIAPYRGELTNSPRNGLLLRADVHTLFDLHLLTVLPVGVIRISPDLAGSEYEALDERLMKKPFSAPLQPDPRRLAAHNATCSWLSAE